MRTAKAATMNQLRFEPEKKKQFKALIDLKHKFLQQENNFKSHNTEESYMLEEHLFPVMIKSKH